jgi:peptidylprolyl isomerase
VPSTLPSTPPPLRYPCFGYVVEGADFLRDVKEGDIIVSAKVTEGAEKLVQPK